MCKKINIIWTRENHSGKGLITALSLYIRWINGTPCEDEKSTVPEGCQLEQTGFGNAASFFILQFVCENVVSFCKNLYCSQESCICLGKCCIFFVKSCICFRESCICLRECYIFFFFLRICIASRESCICLWEYCIRCRVFVTLHLFFILLWKEPSIKNNLDV